jgi:hypothetical protein
VRSGGEDTGRRWVGVGQSREADARVAGTEAAKAAIAGGDPKLLVVFCSAGYDLPALLAAIRSAVPAVRLVGCSTAGEIAVNGGEGVVVFALGGRGFHVATATADATKLGLREAGAEAARCMARVTPERHSALLLLMDAFVGDHQEILRGVYGVVGAGVPLVGGAAGDGLRMERTHQFHDDQLLSGHVVAAAITSEAPIGIGVRHGWRIVGEPMLVTWSNGDRVLTLNDRPALDVYLERLQAPAEADGCAEAFTRFALTRPLGLLRHTREPQARFVPSADFDRRALVCIAEVPTGALVYAMQGDAQSVLEATDAACAEALGALDGRAPLGLLAFDCVARKGVLGDHGARAEVERIAAHAAGAPVAGFYTYGEVARVHGVNGFHNQTLVVLAVG